MINRVRSTTRKITDFTVGSIARTLLEAPAQEIDELYQQMMRGLVEAIPTAVYTSFNFPALPPEPATGPIRVTITSSASAIVIPAGSVFTRPDGAVTYTSTADVTITAGNTYGDVPVTANTAGAVGNTASGTVFTPVSPPQGFVSASNLAAFSNGAEAETEDARKLRFNSYIRTLARATNEALIYGLKTTNLANANGSITERVISAAIVEPYLLDPVNNPPALINAYIHNGAGSTSSALVTQAQKVIYGFYDAQGNAVAGWKAAGVNVTVAAATEQTVAITANLTAASGYTEADLITAAQQVIATYIVGLAVGATAIRAEIIALVMGIEGVSNFALTAPAADVVPASNVKLMPGTFAIS